MDRLAVFCEIDDFCREFEPKFNRQLIADGTRKRIKTSRMSKAEVMTILVLFQQSGFRDLKGFYTKVVCQYWRRDFRNLLSYNRFARIAERFTCFAWGIYADSFREVFGSVVCGFVEDTCLQ